MVARRSSVTWRNRGGVDRKFRRKLQEDMREAAKEAAWAFEQTVIAARRIDSGDMISAEVRESPVRRKATRYEVSWGWSLAERKAHSDRMTSNREPYRSYYDLQNLGFTHTSGGIIEGMHADEAGKRAFKKAMRDRGWK